MSDQKSELPHRYSVLDEYTLEEFRSQYVPGTTAAKVKLLEEVYAHSQLPFEFALMAVCDPDPLVRRWMAKNGVRLDFRSFDLESLESEDAPHRDLWKRLAEDPDPFVRASLQENTSYRSYEAPCFWVDDFETMSHMERLAAMRNPAIGNSTVNKTVLRIFDPKDECCGITSEERVELARAFLANPNVIERSQDKDFLAYWNESYKQLWTLIQHFPNGEIRNIGLSSFGALDSWKAEAYRHFTGPEEWKSWPRAAIVCNCAEQDKQTLKLALEDSDFFCQQVAMQKYVDPLPKKRAVWKYLDYAWNVVSELFMIFILLLLFSRVNSPTERIIVCLLALIYLKIVTSMQGNALLHRSTVQILFTEFRRLAKLVGYTPTKEEKAKDTEREEDFKSVPAETVKFMVVVVARSIIALFIVFNLLAASL